MDPQPKPISVVILPLPAQGHLNQLLHLARHLSACSIPVHYVGSSAHNRQARVRAQAGIDHPASASNLHFHDVPLPPYSTPPPNPNSPINFPIHLQPCFDATLGLAPSLSSLLHSLSLASRRVILIHDSTMSFSANLTAPLPNAESFVFHSVSAFAILYFHLPSSALTFKDCFSDEFMDFIRKQHLMTVKDRGRLFNTCSAIEKEFVDQLTLQPNWKDQKVFSIGPLNPVTMNGPRGPHEALDWLDRQPEKSVVYVSFGTCTSLPKNQIMELAKGLELSKQRFVWVLRDADRGDIYFDSYKDGADDISTEKMGLDSAKGMIVRGWAPQMDILAHRATGAFLSHCGWNSCMESMSMGVPILAWPMHSDQPRNSVLVSEVLKVGIVVRGWDKRGEVLRGEDIRDSISRLMVDEQGKEVARRAIEVGEVIRECGRNQEELDAFIGYITS